MSSTRVSLKVVAALGAALVLGGCTSSPEEATSSPEPAAVSTPTPTPTNFTEQELSSLRSSLEASDAQSVGTYFGYVVKYGSAGSDGRPDQSHDEAVEQLSGQLEEFGPLDCDVDPALVETYRANLEGTMSTWLPADAIVCLSSDYLFSFTVEGRLITGYYTFPVGIHG